MILKKLWKVIAQIIVLCTSFRIRYSKFVLLFSRLTQIHYLQQPPSSLTQLWGTCSTLNFLKKYLNRFFNLLHLLRLLYLISQRGFSSLVISFQHYFVKFSSLQFCLPFLTDVLNTFEQNPVRKLCSWCLVLWETS